VPCDPRDVDAPAISRLPQRLAGLPYKSLQDKEIVVEYLTVPQIAQMLQVKPSTVYSWIRSGDLPCERAGRLIRITPAQLELFFRRPKKKR